MPGKSSQRKGADGERELAQLLRGHGYKIERGGSLSFGDTPDLVGLPGVHIEVKRVERLNVGEAFNQAVRDAEKFQDGMPVLFHRRSRQPWLVTMRFEEWMRLYGSTTKAPHLNTCSTEKKEQIRYDKHVTKVRQSP